MLPLPEPLPADVLALRYTLPLKPAPVVLQGRYIRMQPLDLARDSEGLYAISNGAPITLTGLEYPAYDAEELLWRWMGGGPFASLAAFTDYMALQVNASNGLALVAIDNELGHPLGVATLMSNVPNDLKIELGNIWYTPPVQRSPVNTEATWLMLRHCFGLGYRRVEWKCNARNERSRRAAERMGFQFEGVQESHYIIKDSSRDTAWFRILDQEWPAVQQRLQQLLDG